MPFTSHLEELRSRLIKSCTAVGIAFFGCFAVSEQIFAVLAAPLRRVEVQGLTLIGVSVTEAFCTKRKVSCVAAILDDLPVAVWQIRPLGAHLPTRVRLIEHRCSLARVRSAVVSCATAAPVSTPRDLVSQALLMVPLRLVYGGSTGVAYLARWRRRSDSDES